MKLEIESTTKVASLVISGVDVPARIWEGKTDSGIPVHVFITRVAVAGDQDLVQFERELRACRAPSLVVNAIPLRLIL